MLDSLGWAAAGINPVPAAAKFCPELAPLDSWTGNCSALLTAGRLKIALCIPQILILDEHHNILRDAHLCRGTVLIHHLLYCEMQRSVAAQAEEGGITLIKESEGGRHILQYLSDCKEVNTRPLA